VSHEAIYQSLYVQGRGGLRAELVEALTKRPDLPAQRRDRTPAGERVAASSTRSSSPNVPPRSRTELSLATGREISSSDGPAAPRSPPWSSATTRFVVLVHLPGDHKAKTVQDAMARTIATLPEAMLRSITWDQGKEMATHASFTVDTGIQVYCCEPHHPWQHGTNEHTNGLLRQYLPRSLNLSTLSEEQLDAIADELNGRPRETLGWRTPSERFAELVAMTG
jgi:IS30 family transposase